MNYLFEPQFKQRLYISQYNLAAFIFSSFVNLILENIEPLTLSIPYKNIFSRVSSSSQNLLFVLSVNNGNLSSYRNIFLSKQNHYLVFDCRKNILFLYYLIFLYNFILLKVVIDKHLKASQCLRQQNNLLIIFIFT